MNIVDQSTRAEPLNLFDLQSINNINSNNGNGLSKRIKSAPKSRIGFNNNISKNLSINNESICDQKAATNITNKIDTRKLESKNAWWNFPIFDMGQGRKRIEGNSVDAMIVTP